MQPCSSGSSDGGVGWGIVVRDKGPTLSKSLNLDPSSSTMTGSTASKELMATAVARGNVWPIL